MLSVKATDYLETIYLLSLRHDTVGVSQVAAERSVTIPTARSGVDRLKRKGFVRQEHYGKVVLTKQGRLRAAEIYRTHTLLFHFLHDVLGVERERADTEACRLEHDLSADTVARLTRFMEKER
ncbi:metal-dependent transcriptional regulator [bacterium]|jgi:DtxR family Mn-dependent transcriptional regulator|nr:metal-dependent transcriptional regulator [bacterium]